MPKFSAEWVSVGKLCLPCLGLCQALVLVAAARCSCRGNGVINKLSLHFLREAFLLFSHNMLSCFEKKKKHTEKKQTKIKPNTVPKLLSGGADGKQRWKGVRPAPSVLRAPPPSLPAAPCAWAPRSLSWERCQKLKLCLTLRSI